MPPVFNSKRSQFTLLALKTIALTGVFLPILVVFGTSSDDTRQPAVTPVVALSDQEIEPNPYPWNTLPADDAPDPDATDPDATANTGENQPTTPDDSLADQQWSLHTNPDIAGATGLFGSYDYLTGTDKIVVAVVDSGVILEHEDLDFLPGYDFIHNPTVGNDGDGRDHDPSDPGDWVTDEDINQETVSDGCPVAASKWHGTAIAGVIGATAYNATGIAGGSPHVSLLPVRVTGKCGGYVSDLIDGIRWSAGLEVDGVATNQHPADVINLSVGFPGACSNSMQRAIDDAVNAGSILVTAATNSGVNLDQDPYSPAACNNVLTVAATDREGAITSYTSLGQAVFIAAPGGTVSDGIITTQNDGLELPEQASAYGFHYGTSIAAAHVTSAIANLLSHTPGLSKTQIEQLLTVSASSIDFDPNCRSGQCGEGRLNAHAAMELLASDYLLDNNTILADDSIPVQIAAASSASDSLDAVVSTTTSDDDIWAGSTDTLNILILITLLGTRLCYSKRTYQKH